MANKEKETLMLLTAEFYRHKSHYIEAKYKKKIAEDNGRFGSLSTLKKEMDKHLHKMEAVLGVMKALQVDLALVEAELDVLEELDEEAYTDLNSDKKQTV